MDTNQAVKIGSPKLAHPPRLELCSLQPTRSTSRLRNEDTSNADTSILVDKATLMLAAPNSRSTRCTRSYPTLVKLQNNDMRMIYYESY